MRQSWSRWEIGYALADMGALQSRVPAAAAHSRLRKRWQSPAVVDCQIARSALTALAIGNDIGLPLAVHAVSLQRCALARVCQIPAGLNVPKRRPWTGSQAQHRRMDPHLTPPARRWLVSSGGRKPGNSLVAAGPIERGLCTSSSGRISFGCYLAQARLGLGYLDGLLSGGLIEANFFLFLFFSFGARQLRLAGSRPDSRAWVRPDWREICLARRLKPIAKQRKF